MDTNTDEHDLAKALDSVAAELDAQRSNSAPEPQSSSYLYSDPTVPAPAPGGQPTVMHGAPVSPTGIGAAVTPLNDPTAPVVPPYLTDTTAPAPAPYIAPTPQPAEPAVSPFPPLTTGNSELDTIKNDALLELRPLVDKLSVSPEEKFDTYLLLLRSTDDIALIAPAHEAAKAIGDEARRAEALLDIIKEIDFLSKQQKNN